ncbi:MAG TPA: hypothetical protein PKY88_03485 [Anaerohalosphaeraceae bacterium]|nr:hypothetical protein [Anaerohalosphaeraceae bacterium]
MFFLEADEDFPLLKSKSADANPFFQPPSAETGVPIVLFASESSSVGYSLLQERSRFAEIFEVHSGDVRSPRSENQYAFPAPDRFGKDFPFVLSGDGGLFEGIRNFLGKTKFWLPDWKKRTFLKTQGTLRHQKELAEYPKDFPQKVQTRSPQRSRILN